MAARSYRSRMFAVSAIAAPPEDGGGMVMTVWPR